MKMKETNHYEPASRFSSLSMKHLRIEKNKGTWETLMFPITHGVGGIREDKREGDGATPVGTFLFRKVLYRKDRVGEIQTNLPKDVIQKDDGWCDDPKDPLYNRFVKLPYPGCREEKLWRKDSLYDIIIVVGHNDDPVVPYGGSAVFVHVKHPEDKPTAGCIGLEKDDLLAVLKEASLESCLIVNP